MTGCDEVDVMTADDIEDNIQASSNPESILNMLPKSGVRENWTPSPDDKRPTVVVTLPDVNGVPPDEYEVMTIKIKAENFNTVKVTVTDSEDNIVFIVSLCSFVI